jgi:PucR C-terminal helix-turn-helix domain/GGDEF-like domain
VATATETHPWLELPPEVVDVLRPLIPDLSDEIVGAVGREVEAYRRPMEGTFGRAVRTGTERALSRFLDLIADARADQGSSRRIYVELGRGEFAQGRSLDALLAAYRVGARIAWRRFADAGTAAGLEPEVVYRLGEAMFAYIDGLSAESVEGYAQAQSEAAGESQRRRRRLIGMLVDGPVAEPEAVRPAAEAAGWSLPPRLAAIVASGERAEALAGRLGPEAIGADREGQAVILVGDPDAPGRGRAIERALGDIRAAIGPSVAWSAAGESVARARLALGLAADGAIRADGPIRADQHLPALVIHADPALGRALAERWLAPLDSLGPGPRRKLRATLRAWLDHQGRVEQVARALEIHPQTVRYRVRQLRDALGSALDDPEGRLALAIALRAAPRS